MVTCNFGGVKQRLAFGLGCAHDLSVSSRLEGRSERINRLDKDRRRARAVQPTRFRRHRALSLTMTGSMNEKDDANSKTWALLSLKAAALVSARFVSVNGDEIQSVWSQRDLVAARKRLFSSSYILAKNDSFKPTPSVEIGADVGPEWYYSPSGKKFLKFTTFSKNGPNDGNVTSINAEVWTVGGGLDLTWEIASTTHGPVFTDEWFGSVSWSPDESMIVYAADRPKPGPSRLEPENKQESWIHALSHKFHENARDPFGEAYISRRSPTLFVADVRNGGSFPLCDENSAVIKRGIFGEPRWSPDGENIVATMRLATDAVDVNDSDDVEFLPSDLGLRYCYNRPSSVVMFDAPQSEEDLKSGRTAMQLLSTLKEADDFCCNSPRFSSDGKDLLYVSGPRFANANQKGKVLPHNTTKVLRAVRLHEKGVSPPRTLISIPENPNHDDFPGLYLHSLPENPWLGPETIVFNSVWGSVNKVLSTTFARANNELVPVCGGLQLVDWGSVLSRACMDGGIDSERVAECDNINVLDVCGSALLLSVSNPVTPPVLFSLRCQDWNSMEADVLVVCPRSTHAVGLKALCQVAHTVDLILQGGGTQGTARIYEPNRDDPSLRYQVTILLPPRHTDKIRLIVFPHGGPHVTTLNGYSQGTAALLKKGFAVMYVNYRGSLGLGQKSLETLPGNVGTQEINEVAQATRWALEKAEFSLDPERVGFVGGSHSGFIGAHCSLIPGLFKRTVLRNPVVNIASMVGATDIPDWCFCEANVNSKNENGLRFAPDAEQLRKMYEHSPVSRVKRIQDPSQRPGPTLLQVGGSDRRVPPQQSLEWKRLMTQAYGEDNVIMRWYPESGHAIDEVPNGDDAWVQALDFLCKL